MHSVLKFVATRTFIGLLALSLTGLVACSTGTESGDTNVEEGSSKTRDADARDEPGQNTSSEIDTHQDTIDALMDTSKVKNDAYERSKKTPHTEEPNFRQ